MSLTEKHLEQRHRVNEKHLRKCAKNILRSFINREDEHLLYESNGEIDLHLVRSYGERLNDLIIEYINNIHTRWK